MLSRTARPDVVLRPARADELPDLNDLCLRSKAIWGYDAAFLDACRPELTLTESDLGRDLIVAETTDAPVGLAQIHVSGATGDLWKLFVDPQAMGRGIGRTLLDWSGASARGQGAERLLIEADPGAQPFYERSGAVVIGTAPSGSLPGRVLPLLELRL